MNKKIIAKAILLFGLSFSVGANATVFSKYGYIKRILTDHQYYSGCMVLLDTPLDNECRSSWVSLDCNGLFYKKDIVSGAQMLSNAMSAAQNGNKILIYIDNAKTVNGYCVAQRIDTLY